LNIFSLFWMFSGLIIMCSFREFFIFSLRASITLLKSFLVMNSSAFSALVRISSLTNSSADLDSLTAGFRVLLSNGSLLKWLISLDCSLKIREPDGPGLEVGARPPRLYFIFPGICTLSLWDFVEQDQKLSTLKTLQYRSSILVTGGSPSLSSTCLLKPNRNKDQDCSLKNREPDVLALLVPGSWRLEQDRCGWTVLHLPWNLYPVPFIVISIISVNIIVITIFALIIITIIITISMITIITSATIVINIAIIIFYFAGFPIMILMHLLIKSIFSLFDWTPGALPGVWLWIPASAFISHWREAL
ncbi:hypothetical protein STEG23_011645, partial [Scotinomys teguina]